MKKILYLGALLALHCGHSAAQSDTVAPPPKNKGMIPKYNNNTPAPPPPITPTNDGMSPKYGGGADRAEPIVKMAPNRLTSEDNNVVLMNYAKVPLVMCVSPDANAKCKCLTVNGEKLVRMKLNTNESVRVVKIFNGTAVTKYWVHPGNTYGFKYDAVKKKWAYADF